MLSDLVARLKQSAGILHKQDIQTAAKILGETTEVLLGDDCAAIRDREGYLLLASEGILPQLVETDPWFAGWCGILVNVNDVYAMGGYPIAVVDTLWSPSIASVEQIWTGMQAAAKAFNITIVGGHTNCHSPYHALSVAILGRSQQLISSFKARPGDSILVAANFQGKPYPQFPFCWDAATTADPTQLQSHLAILPELAQNNLCDAGKDISMGGILGTTLMLLETSRVGAVLDLDRIPCPPELSLEDWLISFPSYGFLLSVRPENKAMVQSYFHRQGLICEAIGEVRSNRELVLQSHNESAIFWDFERENLTGF
jgi:uncharacterized protein